jgi:hypothetical protein
MKRYMVAAALVSLSMTPALAQQQQNGLVNLAIDGGVLNDLNIDVLNNSLNDNTVQVPISVAAAVCGIAVNVLAKSRNVGDCKVTQQNVTESVKAAIRRQAGKK